MIESVRIYDKIHIRDLLLRCIIGVNDNERETKQDILLNITLYGDYSAACISDNIEDTVDYKEIKKNIISLVEMSTFFLIEKLASEIADLCLADSRVVKVKVVIDKPGALRFSRSVAVDIERSKPGF
ncbi:dihydroneopterin aldolase [Elusimicrobiota bacterium]